MKYIKVVTVVLLVSAMSRCDGGEENVRCGADELQAALEAAAPGETVRVGACRVTASLTVPAGVTLAGKGPGTSVLVADGPRPAVRLTPGTPPARVTDLSVESAANSAIFVLPGGGEVAVERVRVAATRGIAVAAQDVGSLTMSDVTLTGPVTPENHVGWPDDPNDTATHGLVLVRVANAALRNVTSSGFALFGALLVDSTTTWTRGGAPRNIGTGLMVYRGSATLENLDLTGTLDGDRAWPAYGTVFAGDGTTEAQVQSTGLDVSDGDDYGMLHQQATAAHRDLVANGNGAAGVWVQHCSSFELAGAGTTIEGNAFAGVVGMETARMVVQDARIATTRKLDHTIWEGGREPVGDGIHVVRTRGVLDVRNVMLASNERVGMLLELRDGTTAGITLEGVTATGTGDQFGVLVQHGTAVAGWDSGVTRDPVTTANDAAPHAPLGYMPLVSARELPVASDVAGSGLNGILDPDPPT